MKAGISGSVAAQFRRHSPVLCERCCAWLLSVGQVHASSQSQLVVWGQRCMRACVRACVRVCLWVCWAQRQCAASLWCVGNMANFKVIDPFLLQHGA